MTNSHFKPGFRFSFFDALLLVLSVLGAIIVWPHSWWLGFVIAFVVGHFFLFCNVFRVSRGLEIAWAIIFVIFTWLTLETSYLAWSGTITATLLATAVVIALEIRKNSYHGVGWRRLNPGLPQWWAASSAEKTDPIP